MVAKEVSRPEEIDSSDPRLIPLTHQIEQSRIDYIVSIEGQKVIEVDGVKRSFEEIYSNVRGHEDPIEQKNAFIRKYLIASQLIIDGRYGQETGNILRLIRDFVPKGTILRGEIKEFADSLKDKLNIQMVEAGHITPGTEDAVNAQESISRIIAKDQKLCQLAEVLPANIFEALTRIELFGSISDLKKKEKIKKITMAAVMRDYAGNFEITINRGGELTFKEQIDIMPDEIYRDEEQTTVQYLKHYFSSLAMSVLGSNEEEGFKKLQEFYKQEQSEIKRQFLEEIIQELNETSQQYKQPTEFKDFIIRASGEKSPSLLFRHKYFLVEFMKTRAKYLTPEAGGTKTACAFRAMKEVGAKKVTVIGPALARNTWSLQAEKLFKDKMAPEVFPVVSEKDLDDPKILTAEYVYISTHMLSIAWSSPELKSKIENILINKRGTDGITIDEADEFRRRDSNCSKMIMELIPKVQQNYHSQFKDKMPILALTATPFGRHIKEMDVVMGLLYPERFALPDGKSNNKLTFSARVGEDAYHAHSIIYGEQLMMRWTLQELFGDKLPEIKVKRVPIELSPYINTIYQWIADKKVKTGFLSKINLRAAALTEPKLVRELCLQNGWIPENIRSKKELKETLLMFYRSWQSWVKGAGRDSEIPVEAFSANWIAKFGGDKFLLECFFSGELDSKDRSSVEYGIERLVLETLEVKSDWKSPEAVSDKYAYLKKLLEVNIQRNPDGTYCSNKKFFIMSPFHKKGITQAINSSEQSEINLYEYITSHWLEELPKEMALKVSGDLNLKARFKEAQLWGTEGDKGIITVATLRSISESMDWSIKDTDQNQNIEELVAIALSWSWGWDEFTQWCGRFPRPEANTQIPISVLVLETEDTVDEGLFKTNKWKDLYFQIVVSGVKLEGEDARFFNSLLRKTIVTDRPETSHLFLWDSLKKLQGRSSKEAIEELSKKINGEKDGWTSYAKGYYREGKDEYAIVGNNAELVKDIFQIKGVKRVLSLGAGSCLLARKARKSGLEIEVDNLDYNQVLLEEMKQNHPGIGKIIHQNAVEFSLEDGQEAYDGIDCSYMLSWLPNTKEDGTRLEDVERVKLLTNINKALKLGGTAIISLPESKIDKETFINFTKALELHFGLKVSGPSGKSYAVDVKPKKPLGWVITLEKMNEVNLKGLELSDLNLLSDISKRMVNGKRVNNQVTQAPEPDYPIFSSKIFEVINPLTSDDQKIESVKKVDDTPSETIIEKARRRIEEIFTGFGQNLTPSQSERLLNNILLYHGYDFTSDQKGDTILSLVEQEARNILKKGR